MKFAATPSISRVLTWRLGAMNPRSICFELPYLQRLGKLSPARSLVLHANVGGGLVTGQYLRQYRRYRAAQASRH